MMRKVLVALFVIGTLIPSLGCGKGITMAEDTLPYRGTIDDPLIAGGPKKGMKKADANKTTSPLQETKPNK
jgi:hypothetical protein